MNTLYIKEGVIRERNRITIMKDDVQIICPQHEMLIADGWTLYVTPERTIEQAKQSKIQEIDTYDRSIEVNSFILNGNSVWLSKSDRVVLVNSIQIEQSAGREKSTLWFNGVKLEIECGLALQLLAALELYALDCYNVTSSHKYNVGLLEDITDIDLYDYTTGYPEKLIINL